MPRIHLHTRKYTFPGKIVSARTSPGSTLQLSHISLASRNAWEEGHKGICFEKPAQLTSDALLGSLERCVNGLRRVHGRRVEVTLNG